MHGTGMLKVFLPPASPCQRNQDMRRHMRKVDHSVIIKHYKEGRFPAGTAASSVAAGVAPTAIPFSNSSASPPTLSSASMHLPPQQQDSAVQLSPFPAYQDPQLKQEFNNNNSNSNSNMYPAPHEQQQHPHSSMHHPHSTSASATHSMHSHPPAINSSIPHSRRDGRAVRRASTSARQKLATVNADDDDSDDDNGRYGNTANRNNDSSYGVSADVGGADGGSYGDEGEEYREEDEEDGDDDMEF
ncbi:hypothetical protein HDU79_002317 [Rhizoclosmatium sp. JEL0117]|nr:hypothetical protein HDU79_002317 [Rhizoclosmatium sp. JEL0117]